MGAAPADRPRCLLDGLIVLLIEDHPDSRDAIRQVLVSEGADVVEAADGGEALELLATVRPDVILCDLRMPHVDGFDFIRRFRGGWARTAVPVVAITALGEGLPILRETLAAGFDGHLAKPFDFDAVISAVARAAGRGARKAAAQARRPRSPRRSGRVSRATMRRAEESQAG